MKSTISFFLHTPNVKVTVSPLLIVHYRAWTESTQHKFEDTWQEQRPIELVLGKGNAKYFVGYVVMYSLLVYQVHLLLMPINQIAFCSGNPN